MRLENDHRDPKSDYEVPGSKTSCHISIPVVCAVGGIWVIDRWAGHSKRWALTVEWSLCSLMWRRGAVVGTR